MSQKTRFITFVYPRQAIIECNTHKKRCCFNFENMTWNKELISANKPCACLKRRFQIAELYFINRYENKKFD